MIYYVEIFRTSLTKVLHELSVQLTNPVSRRLVNKSIDAIQIQANNQTETYRHCSPQDKDKNQLIGCLAPNRRVNISW